MRLVRHNIQWLLDHPWIATTIGFVVFALAMASLVLGFSGRVYDMHSTQVSQELEHYAEHARDTLTRRIADIQKSLEYAVTVLGDYQPYTSSKEEHLLSGVALAQGMTYLSIQSSDEKSAVIFGQPKDAIDQRRISALSEQVKSIAVINQRDGQGTLTLYRYVSTDEHGVVYALCSQAPTDDIVYEVGDTPHGGVGQARVVNGQGQTILFIGPHSARSRSASVEYKVPVGINDWVLVMEVPESYVRQATADSMIVLLQFALATAGLMFGVFVCFWLYQFAMRRRAQLGEHCFRALAERSNDIVFEWNLETERMISANNVEKVFGRGVENPDEFYWFVKAARTNGLIYEEDLAIFEQAYQDVFSGVTVDECRYRAMNSDGEWIWCALQSTVVLDFAGKPYRVVGTVSDVDKQVRESESLRLLAQRDLMTGLYNKVSVEQLVVSYLESHRELPGSCAFVIIDMDDLKVLNDTHGHPAGDFVITELAKALREQFRDTDIIGRIGGDEFVVFIKKVHDAGAVLDRVNQVQDNLSGRYEFDTGNYFATVSIGVVVADYTVSYSELYRQADEQLYETKRESKETANKQC